MVIFGTRPEAIKLATVIKAIQKSRLFDLLVCSTGQHKEMLDSVLASFSISPDYELSIMTPNQNLFQITSRAMLLLGKLLSSVSPDLVVIQGDTTTAFAAALSAFYLKIPVAHVEAGLRTFNKYAPFPEEVNRKLITHLADIHFAPTKTAEINLRQEGIKKSKIFVTGNTIVDAMHYIVKKWDTGNLNGCKKAVSLVSQIRDSFYKKIILLTCHRRESFGGPLENIFHAIKKIAIANPQFAIVFPVHLNPNVKKYAHKLLGGITNIFLIEPLPYEDFLYILRCSYLIITDSGGIQEEAPSFKKPLVVLRQVTERPEGIYLGCAKIVGYESESIFNTVHIILNNKEIYSQMKPSYNPYGDGKASQRILKILKEKLWESQKM